MSKKPEKPKTRKAQAAKRAAPKAATNQASSEPKREISEIRCMLSRLRFLEADANNRAEEAETDDESERLRAVHEAENHKIMKALRILIPRDFSELSELLRHVLDEIKVADTLRCDGSDIDILTNIVEALPAVIGYEMEAARRMGMTNMRDFLSSKFGAAFDVAKEPKAMERIQWGNTAWDNA
jgi:hypothetical protein